MVTLILARHGETVWHATNRYAGRTDVALTDRGRDQAESLGRWARDAKLDAIVTSTLSRAVLTAAPAVAATGLTPTRFDALVEVDFGDGEGLTRTEMAEAFPAALADFLATPARSPLPGAESGLAAIARARVALEEIAATYPDGRVLIVMHSTLLRLLLCDLLGIEPDRYRTTIPEVVNCALTTVRIGRDGGAQFLSLNVPPE